MENCEGQCTNDATCPLLDMTSTDVLFRPTLAADPDSIAGLSIPHRINDEATTIDAAINANLTIGLTYRFMPPVDSTNVTGWTRYLDHVGNSVQYRLGLIDATDESAAADDVLINTASGLVQVSPTSDYTATFQLNATDNVGQAAELLRWTFTTLHADTANTTNGPNQLPCERGAAVDGVRYDGNFTCDCGGTGYGGENCEVVDLPQLRVEHVSQYIPVNESSSAFAFWNRTQWALNKTYQVAPANIGRLYTIDDDSNETNHDLRRATFQLHWASLDIAPRGFFVDGSSGEMLVRIPNKRQNLTAYLQVTVPGTLPAVAATIHFDMLPADTDNPDANGPNNETCFHNGTKVEDGAEFNLKYRCDCSGTFTGENCETSTASTSTVSSTDEAATTAYAVVGSLLAVLAVAAIATRQVVLHARRQPVDLAAMQADILAGLGLGSALNISTDEIALTLSLEASSPVENWSAFEAALLVVLRQLSGLPSRLIRALREQTTTLKIEGNSALLRMKRPATAKSNVGEVFATSLHRKVTQRNVHVQDRIFINDVSIAIPTRVPKELDRRHVLRLGSIGAGNFGEVFKATVKTASLGGGSVSLTAAVKTLKTSTDESRANLLREAALMALFDHPNVVAMLGVVTVPRHMPAMLVLEFCENGTLLEHVAGSNSSNVNTSRLLTYCHDVVSGMHYLSSRRIVHRDLAARNVLLDAAMLCKVGCADPAQCS